MSESSNRLYRSMPSSSNWLSNGSFDGLDMMCSVSLTLVRLSRSGAALDHRGTAVTSEDADQGDEISCMLESVSGEGFALGFS